MTNSKKYITERWTGFRTTIRGTWEISDFGRVRLVSPDRSKIWLKETYPSGGTSKARYNCLTNNQIKYVHRAVATAYVPNPSGHPIVNHKDGNKLNNHYTNLEWVTYKYNAQHYHQSKAAKQIVK